MNDFRRFLVKIGAASFAIGAGMETFMCFTGACVHSSLRNSALLTPLTSISAAAGFYDIVTRKEAEKRAELRAKMDELKAQKLSGS